MLKCYWLASYIVQSSGSTCFHVAIPESLNRQLCWNIIGWHLTLFNHSDLRAFTLLFPSHWIDSYAEMLLVLLLHCSIIWIYALSRCYSGVTESTAMLKYHWLDFNIVQLKGIVTCVQNMIPGRNNIRQTPPVRSILLLPKCRGYWSIRAVITTSIPMNWKNNTSSFSLVKPSNLFININITKFCYTLDFNLNVGYSL